MNRRQLIAGAVAASVVPALAQDNNHITWTPDTCEVESTEGGIKMICGEEDIKANKAKLQFQYDVCKERGHTPTVYGTQHAMNFSTMPFVMYSMDHAALPYPHLGASEWQVCWYCKTRYRFVTTIEESN